MQFKHLAFRRHPSIALLAAATFAVAGAAHAGNASMGTAQSEMGTRAQAAGDPLQQRANEAMPHHSVASPDMQRVVPVAGDPMQTRASQAMSRDAVTQSDLPSDANTMNGAEQAAAMNLPADAVRNPASLDRNGDHLVSPEEMEQALGMTADGRKTAEVKR